jgi:hypothetical protein
MNAADNSPFSIFPNKRDLFFLAGFYFILHLAIIWWTSPFLDSAFLSGDRSASRLEKIIGLTSNFQNGIAGALERQGIPGDYIVHAAIWTLFGAAGVIAFQTIFGFASVISSVFFVRIIGGDRSVQLIAGILICLMPASLMSPHVLVTDGLFAASIALACCLFLSALQTNRAAYLVGSLSLLEFGSFLRPQSFLLFGLWFLIIAFRHRSLLRPFALSAAACLLLFPGAWLAWRYAVFHQLGMGQTDFDIAVNFWERAERISKLAGVEVPNASTGRLGISDFIFFAFHYPAALLKSFITDLLNLTLNPGANHLFGHFLRLIDAPANFFFWKNTLEQQGILYLLKAVLQKDALFIFVFLAYSIFHVAILFFSAIGVAVVFRTNAASSWARKNAILMIVIAMTLIVPIFISGNVRWAHRAPLEPILASFAAIGIIWAARFLLSRRKHVPRGTSL